jgi:integrase
MKRKGPRPTRDIAGVQLVVSRYQGRIAHYRYHRATRVRLKYDPGSAKDLDQIRRLDERADSANSDRGTLGALIRAYRDSVAWRRLAKRTQQDYARVFDWLADLAPMPVAEITPPFVAALRDKAQTKNGWRLANYVVTCLSILFVWGREFGLTIDNPAHRIKKLKPPVDRARGRKNKAWNDQEWAALAEAAPVWVLFPCAVARYLGARQGDVVAMTIGEVSGDVARWTARKNNYEVEVPVVPEFAAIRAQYLEWRGDAPAGSIACLNSRRDAWSQNGFRATFFKLLARLVEKGRIRKGLTFHGLRSTHAHDWARRGDTRTIGMALGDRTESMARHYAQEEGKGARLSTALRDSKK